MNTEHISDLLDIYERFGDNAQKALDFAKRNTDERNPSNDQVSGQSIANGVYIIYEDDTFLPAESAKKGKISRIGIALDGHYFSVPLDWNYGKSRLLEKDKYPEDEYCQREMEAIMDWDFVKHTNHLKELGLAIELKDGHYLPTIPVFGAMYKNRKCLNEALLAAGAEEIDFDEDRWCAQRCNVDNAWCFNGGNRYLDGSYVNRALQCGAVSLWNPKL